MAIQSLDHACDHSSFRINLPQHNVIRTDALENLKYQLKNKPKYIFVSGEPGIGKTILLNQFIEQSNKSKIIKLLLTPQSSFSKDISYIENDLCRQLSWLLFNEEPTIENLERPSFYSNLIQSLSYRSNRDHFIFIIDGLNSKEMSGYREEILSLLPLHIPEITFIFSSNDEKLDTAFSQLLNNPSDKYYSYNVPIFNKSEMAELLDMCSEDEIETISKTFSPIPTVLLMLKELISKGRSLSNILDTHDDVNGNLYEMEWKLNSSNVDQIRYMIALIASSPFQLDLNTLEKHSELNSNELCEKLACISFVEITEGKASISSDGFRQFIKTKLIDLQNDVLKSIDSISKEIALPPTERLNLLKHSLENNKVDFIQEKTSDASIEIDFQETNSTNFASKLLEIKYKACVLQKDISETLKTSYLLSLTKGSSEIPVLETELNFLLKNENYQTAYNLAERSVSIEDKIQMLSLVATNQKNEYGEADNNQLNKIKFLLSKIKVTDLPLNN